MKVGSILLIGNFSQNLEARALFGTVAVPNFSGD